MKNKVRKITPEEKALISESYCKYYKDLHIYVASHFQDIHAVDDVISETFALACEKIDQFKTHPNQKAWLILVAHNKALEMRRWLYKSHLTYMKDMADEPSSDCSQYAVKEITMTAKKELTPEEHKRFFRYFIWGYSLKELADLEGISTNNLSVRLSRIRKKLTENL